MATLHELEDGNILAETAGITNGDHVCVLYDASANEWAKEISAFFADGFGKGERCFYVWDESPPEPMLAELTAGGVDVELTLQSGALRIWTGHQWHNSDTLDALQKAAQVRGLIERAFADGFKGVRFAVEMTWTKRAGISADDVESWEGHSNTLFDKSMPVRVMCLYGRERLSPSSIRAGLNTHPLILDQGGLHQT